MDSSQKPDVRLVERTGQKPTPVEKTTEVSLRSPAEDQYRTASPSVALKVKLCAMTCRARRMGDGSRPRTAATRSSCSLESNEGRLPELVPIRHGRMVQSPFAFFRGSAALMAADLAHTPNSGLRCRRAATLI